MRKHRIELACSASCSKNIKQARFLNATFNGTQFLATPCTAYSKQHNNALLALRHYHLM